MFDDGAVRNAPPPTGLVTASTFEACRRCAGSGVAWHRDRVLFWVCVLLFAPAVFFVPKKPSCIRCRGERWDVVQR